MSDIESLTAAALELIERLKAAEAALARVRAVTDEGKRTVHGRLALADNIRAALAPSTPPDAQSGDLAASDDTGGASGHRDDTTAQSGDFEGCAHEWSLGGRPGKYWRECWLCGAFEDLDQQGDA